MASEIRVDKINSLSGVGTVTLSPTGVDIAGITTAATLRATTGIVTSLTAGSLTSLGAVSGTTGTFSGAISGATLTSTGTVTIPDKIVHTGDTDTAIRFAGDDIVTIETGGSERVRVDSAGLKITDKLLHSGDIDTALRFPAADTITAETGGSERLRIDSSGRLLLGTTTEGHDDADEITISGTRTGITIRSANDDYGNIFFSDATSTASEYIGAVQYYHADNSMRLKTSSTDRFIIDSSGNVNIGSASPRKRLDITGPDGRSGASPGNSDTALVIDNDGGNGAIMEFCSDNNAYGRIFFTDTDASNQGGIIYEHGDDSLNFNTNGSERVSISSGGNLTISDGDLVIGTSGHGISFAATSDGSGATGVSELLDDYEEGTFIVTLANSLAATGTQKKLTYTKIGNKVHISGQFQVTTGGSDLVVNNLPFTTKSTGGTDETFSTSLVKTTNVTFPTDGSASGEIQAMVLKNDTNMSFVYTRSGNDPNSHTATTNGYYTVSLWYTV